MVYIRNLTVEATEEKIKTHFEQWGKVERVKKMKDYCFVHFEERECALKVGSLQVVLKGHDSLPKPLTPAV